MTDRVYTLRPCNVTRTTGKFYTSPYTAVLAGERLRRELPNPEQVRFALETHVLDIQEVPCDHTVVKDFVTGFVNHVLLHSHRHGFILLEKETCVYELRRRGAWIAEVMILYIPPSLDPGSMDVGEPVLRVMTDCDVEDKGSYSDFSLLFSSFCDQSW